MKTNNTLSVLGICAVVGLTLGAATAKNTKKTPPPKVSKTQLAFTKADANADGSLSIFEFAKTQGPGTPMVEVRSRFLAIDVSGAFEVVIDPVTGVEAVDPVTGLPVVGAAIPDGLVTLAEWEAYLALEDKPKSTLTRFELADFDGDGQLTPVEFGYLVSPRVPYRNIIRGFDKLDTIIDDGLLSPEECTKTRSGTI